MKPVPSKATYSPANSLGSWMIDGELFCSMWAIHKRHKELGGTLSSMPITKRLKSVACSWAEINAPVDDDVLFSINRANKAHAAKRLSAKAEMAELLRQLDERKRQIRTQT